MNDSTSNTPIGSTMSAPTPWTPPKNWDEITLEEKVERTREVSKQNIYSVHLRMDRMEQLIRSLKNHKHDAEGNITIKLQDVDYLLSGLSGGGLQSSLGQTSSTGLYF